MLSWTETVNQTIQIKFESNNKEYFCEIPFSHEFMINHHITNLTEFGIFCNNDSIRKETIYDEDNNWYYWLINDGEFQFTLTERQDEIVFLRSIPSPIQEPEEEPSTDKIDQLIEITRRQDEKINQLLQIIQAQDEKINRLHTIVENMNDGNSFTSMKGVVNRIDRYNSIVKNEDWFHAFAIKYLKSTPNQCRDNRSIFERLECTFTPQYLRDGNGNCVKDQNGNDIQDRIRILNFWK